MPPIPEEGYRLASDAPFPYGNPTVTFMIVDDGKVRQVTLSEARAQAQQGKAVYGVWPGKWRSDLFLLDDI
jgi:hypothetical protein